MQIANEQKTGEGGKDVANFVLSLSTKALSDLFENTDKMESASKKSFFLETNPHGSDS